MIQNKKPNNYGPAPTVPVRTVYNIGKRSGAVKVQGEVKNDVRVAGHDLLRSNLADVCMLDSVMKSVDPMLFFSSDDVSVCFGDGKKPYVITTKEALDWLKNHNLAVATKQKRQKRRVVTYNVTIGARDGRRLCVVIKIADRCFTHITDKPKIYNMGVDVYIMLYHAGMSEEVVQREMYDKVICRLARKERDDLVARGRVGLRSVATDDSADLEASLERAGEAAAEEQRAIVDRYKWIALAFDGQISQVKGICTLNEKWQEKVYNVILSKFSAGMSLEESPNDVGPMHRILKTLFRGADFLFEDDIPDPAGESWKELKTVLKKYLDSSSFLTIWKALRYSPAFMDRAFNQDAIRKVFRDAGIFPSNAGHLLSKNPFFDHLDQQKADHVVAQVDPLTAIMDAKGYIPDESFDQLLNDQMEGTDNWVAKVKGKQLNDMSISRQYAMILSNPSFESDKQTRETARQEKLNAKQHRKKSVGTVAGGAKKKRKDAPGGSEAVESEDNLPVQKKGKKSKSCYNTQCSKMIDGADCVDGCGWTWCDVKWCRHVYCESCVDLCDKHCAEHGGNRLG